MKVSGKVQIVSGTLCAGCVSGCGPIRRVKGVKLLGRRVGTWLSADQAQRLVNTVPHDTPLGRRDGAMLGLLVGSGLRRSEAAGLRLEQMQLRERIWYPTIVAAVAAVSATNPEASSNRFSFCLATLRSKPRNGISDASKTLNNPSMIASEFQSRAMLLEERRGSP